ncbi:hypothetical protein FHG87_006684 [Trinorchestia longiramus]|nr:hypothetical protein FHG87_006684 [Trinorchestia longiramus]
MTYYENSFSKRKGNYPRKSERELESFLPDNMKTPHVFSGRSTRFHDYKKQSTLLTATDEVDSKYSYSDSAKKFISRQNKENKRNGYINEDTKPKKEWNESVQGDFHGRDAASSFPKPVFMKPKKIVKPFAKISSETFQTAAIDKMPVMPPQVCISRSSPVTVLSRNIKKEVEKKEPVKRIQILKPASSAGPSSTATASPPVPIILSRSKPQLEKEFKILSPATKMTVARPSYTSGRMPPLITHKSPFISGLDSKVVPAKQMRQPFRIIDAEFMLCEGYTAFNAYLLEQPNFVVVGVVGRQGVGKSTIASLLTQTTLNGSISERGFRVSGRSELLKGSHCTGGIDAFISQQRVIVLDFPAIIAPGVLDASVSASDLGRCVLCVCVCWMPPPLTWAGGRWSCRCTPSLWSCWRLPCVCATSSSLCRTPGNRAHSSSGVSRSDFLIPVLIVTGVSAWFRGLQAAADVNHRDYALTTPIIHRSTLSTNAVELRAAIMGLPRRTFPGYDTAPTERDWFEYVIREWEKILKSSLYLDYSRLFP